MPPECRQNNMQVDPQPEVMKLTELETSLIARNILFMKILKLPKSRWTGNTDKIINVPIPEDSILNTIKSLPRTPNEAGLIGVEIKRKLSFKNTYLNAQMVNPVRIYDAMRHLKTEGNPYYQFYTDPQAYEERCAQEDDDDLLAAYNPDEPTPGENLGQEDEVEGDVEREQENEDQIIRDEE